MSLAWTTVAIVALLLPGVFFFLGLSTYERLSRETIRSGVVSELALAIFVAALIHALLLGALWRVGFQLGPFVAPAIAPEQYGAGLVSELVSRLFPTAAYFFVAATFGFGLGVLASFCMVRGWLRVLATHKWIYDIIDASRKGSVVTAYVMTNTVQNGNALMYRGRLHEFYLSKDGKLSYIVLKNTARYYMTFGADGPRTGKQLELFGSEQQQRSAQVWDYLLIDGANISNTLFDSGPQITRTDEGKAALDQALKELVDQVNAGGAASKSRVTPG